MKVKTAKRPEVVTSKEWRALEKQGKAAGLAKTSTIQRKDGKVSFVASSMDSDRYGDTIDQTGWELANFKANPVLLWAHSNGTPPVGKVGTIDFNAKGDLEARDIEFTPADAHPLGDQVGKMVKGGFLNAVSVGFLPLEWEARLDEDGMFLGYHFKRQELLEISIVPVPANPMALISEKGFANTLHAWADEPDISSPMARSYQAKLNGFLKAVEDREEREAEAQDEQGFEVMKKLLSEILKATRENTAVLKQVLAGPVTKAAAEEEKAEEEPVDDEDEALKDLAEDDEEAKFDDAEEEPAIAEEEAIAEDEEEPTLSDVDADE